MRKIFLLKKLDCANCAAKIENKVAKIKGVEEVSVNFMTTKMIIEAEENQMDEIIQQAEKIIHQLEPDVEIVSC